MSVFVSVNGGFFSIIFGPIFRTNNKYKLRITRTGNGEPIRNHESTCGSNLK